MAPFGCIAGVRFLPGGKLFAAKSCGCWAARALSLQSSKIPGGGFCQYGALKGEDGDWIVTTEGTVSTEGEGAWDGGGSFDPSVSSVPSVVP